MSDCEQLAERSGCRERLVSLRVILCVICPSGFQLAPRKIGQIYELCEEARGSTRSASRARPRFGPIYGPLQVVARKSWPPLSLSLLQLTHLVKAQIGLDRVRGVKHFAVAG